MASTSSKSSSSSTFSSAAAFAASTAKPAGTSSGTSSGTSGGGSSSGSSGGGYSAPVANAPKTFTNTATGKTIAITDVNNLTPAQKIIINNAIKSGTGTFSGGTIPTSTTTASKTTTTNPQQPFVSNGKALTLNQRNSVQQAYQSMAANDPQGAEAYKAKIESGLKEKGYNTGNLFTTVNAPVVKQDNIITQADKAKQLAERALASLSAPNLAYDVKQKEVAQFLANELKAKRERGEKVTPQDIKDVQDAMKSVTSSTQVESTALSQKSQENIKAPNGKDYTLYTDPKTGLTSFTGQDGLKKEYNSRDEALAVITKANPEGSTPMFQKNIPTEVQPGTQTSSIDGKPTVNIESGQAVIDQAVAQKQENMNTLSETEQNTMNKFNKLVTDSAEIDENQKATLNERMQGMTQSFNTINGLISGLEEKAKNLFDAKATRAATARAQQFADKGYLMDDQVAQVAEYDLGNYRRDIEIQKSEIDKQIAEQRIAIQQEKAKAIDAIQKDIMLTEQQKQQQINYLNQTYTNLTNMLSDKQIEINNQFNTTTQNVLGNVFQQDLGISQPGKEAEAAITVDRAKREATKKDANARTIYILDTLRANDPQSLPFAQQAIDSILSKFGTTVYLGKELDSLISIIQQNAREKMVALQKKQAQAVK